MKILILTILTAFSFCTIAFAGDKHERGDRHKKILEELSLSQAQKEQLLKLKQEDKKEMKQLKKDKRSKKQEMNQALSSDTSEEDLIKLHTEISQLQKKLKEKRFRKMLAIRKILSPDQRKDFFRLKKKMRKNRRNNHVE